MIIIINWLQIQFIRGWEYLTSICVKGREKYLCCINICDIDQLNI